ncbi:hypothetical protein BaRGS_00006836 [Batillaria attramentaria]|uniref:Secreted protein n=1 Tax=Batillaria attramentaria TaxID=370345 RepID=A0ABD0LQV9_9CAEN
MRDRHEVSVTLCGLFYWLGMGTCLARCRAGEHFGHSTENVCQCARKRLAAAGSGGLRGLKQSLDESIANDDCNGKIDVTIPQPIRKPAPLRIIYTLADNRT